MGYTHYWEIHRSFTDKEWESLVDEANRIIGLAKKLDIRLGDALGDFEPSLNEKHIALNGYGSEGCESFVLTKKKRDRAEWETERENDAVFEFCKTRQLPYDDVVISILNAAKQIAPEAIKLSSDGGAVFEPRIDIIAMDMLGASPKQKAYAEVNKEIVEKNLRETLDKVCSTLDINFMKFGVSEDLHKVISVKYGEISEKIDILSALFNRFDSFFEVAEAFDTEVKTEFKLFKNLNEIKLINQYGNH
jgi:hypothetical protein